jgi:hypothetical protein
MCVKHKGGLWGAPVYDWYRYNLNHWLAGGNLVSEAVRKTMNLNKTLSKDVLAHLPILSNQVQFWTNLRADPFPPHRLKIQCYP